MFDDVYVAFLEEVARCSCRTVSPESTLNFKRAQKLP